MNDDLVERLRHTAEWGIPDFTNSALLKEAANRIVAQAEVIAVIEDDVKRLHTEKMEHFHRAIAAESRANQAESALANAVEVIQTCINALDEADTQIEYLHDKFKTTATGVAVIARIDIAATAARDFVKEHGK